MNDRPRSRPLDNVLLQQRRAHANSPQVANGNGVARVANARARDACAARYKSGSWQRAANLRRRRHTRASTAMRDEPTGRVAPKNSSLLPVSAQSERLATSSFRICSTFVHSARPRPSLSAYRGDLLSRREAKGARRLELINNRFAPCAIEAGHPPRESNCAADNGAELEGFRGNWGASRFLATNPVLQVRVSNPPC